MRVRRILLHVIVISAVGACTAPRVDPRTIVLAMLQAHEAAPTPAGLEKAGSGEPIGPLLASIAADRQAPPLARTRAVAALGFFPCPQGMRALDEIARGGATSYVRDQAVRSLERARGNRQ